jgi:2-hydroxy-3-oxopropionate reductase
MGKPMAQRLIEAGHTLYVYDKVASAMTPLSEGATVCSSPKEVAEKTSLLFLMLPDTPDVEEVLFGKDGVAEGIREGSIVIDMSSISPTATRRFAERLRGALQVEMLDAPVSGGQIGAENGTLSIMVGGKEAIFSRIRPYFGIMGKNIVHIGGNGDGQVCKVANQIVVALTIEAVSEALVLSSKAGADPAKVRQALLGGFAQSKILEVHGERMLKRTFAPGFRIRLHQKDLNLALQTARELGVSLPGTAIAQELFNAANAEDAIDLDHSAMITVLEKMAHHKVG